MTEYLTTRDLANRFDVTIQTASLWCREGRFPNAFQINARVGMGQIWLIPADDIEGFERPGAEGVGRPRKA